MTHLSVHWQYVAAAYTLTLGCSVVLGMTAFLRLKQAKSRLAAMERRREHEG